MRKHGQPTQEDYRNAEIRNIIEESRFFCQLRGTSAQAFVLPSNALMTFNARSEKEAEDINVLFKSICSESRLKFFRDISKDHLSIKNVRAGPFSNIAYKQRLEKRGLEVREAKGELHTSQLCINFRRFDPESFRISEITPERARELVHILDTLLEKSPVLQEIAKEKKREPLTAYCQLPADYATREEGRQKSSAQGKPPASSSWSKSVKKARGIPREHF